VLETFRLCALAAKANERGVEVPQERNEKQAALAAPALPPGAVLQATCAALPAVAEGGHDPAVVRERASDALGHMCRFPKLTPPIAAPSAVPFLSRSRPMQ
jgi:hypothetical protein